MFIRKSTVTVLLSLLELFWITISVQSAKRHTTEILELVYLNLQSQHLTACKTLLGNIHQSTIILGCI